MAASRPVALIADISRERAGLERLAAEMRALLLDLPQPPTFLQIRAAGSILHDFYTAAEKIFREIALRMDGDLPRGDDWHVRLLRRMATDIPGVRPPVISQELERDLAEYLRFRHLFRNIYGFDLRWELMDRPVRRLPTIQKELDIQLEAFSGFLSNLPGR